MCDAPLNIGGLKPQFGQNSAESILFPILGSLVWRIFHIYIWDFSEEKKLLFRPADYLQLNVPWTIALSIFLDFFLVITVQKTPKKEKNLKN